MVAFVRAEAPGWQRCKHEARVELGGRVAPYEGQDGTDMTRANPWNMLPITFVALLVAASVVLLVDPKPSEAAFPGQSGKKVVFDEDVSYESDGNYESQIFTVNVDGSGRPKNLTPTEDARTPMFSPAGDQIVYQNGKSYYDAREDSCCWGEIYTMNSDGTNKMNLTNSPSVHDAKPVFSPDGTMIAFEQTGDAGRTHLYVMAADGTGQRRLTSSHASSETSAAFSPSGDKIVFSRQGSQQGSQVVDLYIVDVAADGSDDQQYGAEAQRLTFTDDAWEPAASFSPDGTKILFHTYHDQSIKDDHLFASGNYNQVWIINADGSDQRPLTSGFLSITPYTPPTFSPDGEQIVFARDDHFHDPAGQHRVDNDLFIMDSDGSHKKRLTDKGRQSTFSFSPSGERIVFRRYLHGKGGMWTMTPNGSNKRKISGGVSLYGAGFDGSTLDWQVRQ